METQAEHSTVQLSFCVLKSLALYPISWHGCLKSYSLVLAMLISCSVEHCTLLQSRILEVFLSETAVSLYKTNSIQILF